VAFRPLSGVANPEKADYSAAASSPVSLWAPHGVIAALCCCTKSNAQTPAWGRKLRAPPEGDDDALAVPFGPAHNLARCRGRDQPASAPQHQLRQRISGTTYRGPGERQRAAFRRCRGRRVKFRPTLTCRPPISPACTISLGIGAFRGFHVPELRSWLSASDREIPVLTGVHGTLMARRSWAEDEGWTKPPHLTSSVSGIIGSARHLLDRRSGPDPCTRH
jgi:hypothetical protein